MPVDIRRNILVRKTSEMVEAGILAAIAVLFAILGTYLPVLGVIFNFLWAVPVAVCGMRNGLRWSIMTLIVAGAVIGSLLGPVQALSVMAMFGLLGLALGECMYRGYTPAKTLVYSSAATFVSILLSMGLAMLVMGTNPVDIMFSGLEEALNETPGYYRAAGMSEEQIAAAVQSNKDMIELIPAIDIIDGKCVRLTQGDYATKKVYNEDPLEVAKMFEGNGIRRLHVVDLDGAREGRIINYRILERIATRTSLIIDFGGGLKQEDDLEIAFESGAQMVTGGSIAVKNPEMFTSWISKFGSEKIILGADAKEKKIAISGWEETTSQELVPFIKGYYDKGITKVICTDIARDGMLQGPAIDLYKEIRDEIPFLYIIASGGVSSIEDIEKLSEAGIPAVIFGKAIYEGKIQLKDLLRFT